LGRTIRGACPSPSSAPAGLSVYRKLHDQENLMMTGITPSVANPGPAPEAAARIIGALRDHPCWSAFWDKAYGVWRVADDDPDSGLYAESSDVATVISYIQAHS
jgi:hypothetical protein